MMPGPIVISFQGSVCVCVCVMCVPNPGVVCQCVIKPSGSSVALQRNSMHGYCCPSVLKRSNTARARNIG